MENGTFFLDQGGRLRTVWRFLIFGTGLLIVWLMVGVAVSVVAVAALVTSGRAPDVLAALTQLQEEQLLLFAVGAVPSVLAALGVVWLCRRFLDRRSLSSLGLVRPAARLTSSVWVGLAAGALPIGLSVALLLALGELRSAGAGGSALTALLLAVFLVAAFQEELVFRGYLLQNMLDIRRPVSGVLFTSVLFCLMHSLNPHVWASVLGPLNLFLAGVLLALGYIVSGNLWFPSAMHFAWNFCQGGVFGIPVSGVPVPGLIRLVPAGPGGGALTGGRFGLEASLILVLLQGAMIAVFLAILHRRSAARASAA